MNNICRTCLRSPEILLPLFEDAQLPHKIKIISCVQVSASDSLPSKVCAECVININLAYNFRRVVINSDLELRDRYKYLQNKEIQNQRNIQSTTHSKTCPSNSVGDAATTEANTDKYFVKIKNEKLSKCTEEDFSINETREGIKPVNSKQKIEILPKKRILLEDGATAGSKANAKQISRTPAHIRIRYNFKPKNKMYKCGSCDFTTIIYSKYRNHQRNHDTIKSICNICGKSIRTDNLKKHISIHTESPVACKECGKVCKNTESLRGHAIIHKGIELKCKLCGKVYKYRSGYAQHVKRHALGDDASKTVKCHLCPKLFRGKTDLKKHLRSHTGERPYPCEFCKKGFSSSYALKTHKRQHTNEKPYACEFCSMAFPQKVSLRTHLKSKHPTKTENL